MEWIADPTGWLGLGTLILLEIVLGIDNLISSGSFQPGICMDHIAIIQRRIRKPTPPPILERQFYDSLTILQRHPFQLSPLEVQNKLPE